MGGLRNQQKSNKGFTLIEIIIVMAIAGLIFLIVFLGVAGAQRARRDTQRKSDAAKILAQFEQYASNTNGSYPTTWGTNNFQATYVTPLNLKDPTNNAAYTFGGFTTTGTPGACPAFPANGPATVIADVVGTKVTVRMCLEAGFQDLKNF